MTEEAVIVQSLNKYQKKDMRIPLNLMWLIIINWIKGDSEPEIEKVTEPLAVYKVALKPSIGHPKIESQKMSVILKKCEGSRGILYMNEDEEHPFFPQSVLKRTKIIEVKNNSIKIRVHEAAIINQLIYTEHVWGFLKEVD